MFGRKHKEATASPLVKLECEPCSAGTPALEGEKLEQYLAMVEDWQCQDGCKKITKTYKFADWAGAADFVNRVAMLADQQGHHPDILLTWGKVEVTCSTHKIGGLSENDFILASKIDAMLEGASLE